MIYDRCHVISSVIAKNIDRRMRRKALRIPLKNCSIFFSIPMNFMRLLIGMFSANTLKNFFFNERIAVMKRVVLKKKKLPRSRQPRLKKLYEGCDMEIRYDPDKIKCTMKRDYRYVHVSTFGHWGDVDHERVIIRVM